MNLSHCWAEGVIDEVCFIDPRDSNRTLCGQWRDLVPRGVEPGRVHEACREAAERIGREGR